MLSRASLVSVLDLFAEEDEAQNDYDLMISAYLLYLVSAFI